MSNSFWYQPQTMLSPNRPPPMWWQVTICLAAKTGLISVTCRVPNAMMRRVAARMPAAQVSVSKFEPLWSVSPP